MSLLQDILDKMYVAPEVLEQLDEEQKQTLFIKMREEQVRRWEINEQKAEDEEKINPKPKKNKPGIKWLLGRDQNIWVWVMGEHSDDLSIEEIIERENQRKARELAENEVVSSSISADEQPVDNSLNEEYLKKQLSQIKIIDHDKTNGTQQPSVSFAYNECNIDENGSKFILPPSVQQSQISSPTPYQSYKRDIENYSSPEKRVPPPIPNRPAFLQRKEREEPIGQTVKSYIPGNNTTERYNAPRSGPVPFPSIEETNQLPSRNFIDNKSNINGNNENKNEFINFRKSPIKIVDEVEKRQSEIFEQLMDQKERLRKEAEAEEEARLKAFEEQEKKSREVDAEIKHVVQKAREKYHQKLRTSDSIIPLLNDKSNKSFKSLCRQARPPKPANREAIIRWYINNELPQGTGLDPKTGEPARWFHGIISRADSEKLLADKERGSFLVRVSEKIWGYTVSYVVSEGKTKHYLVESIPEGYQFLGTEQVVHRTLFDLILFHETVPITTSGKEILKYAVGQSTNIPDYAELIDIKKFNGTNRAYGYYHSQQF